MNINQKIANLILIKCKGNKSEFARKINVGPTVIENIVGKRKSKPSYDVLKKIFESDLGIDPNSFFLDVLGTNIIEQAEYNMLRGAQYSAITNCCDKDVDVLTNSAGNIFYLLPNGKIEIEVFKIPFYSYVSYIKVYKDKEVLSEIFDKVVFNVNQIFRGNLLAFEFELDVDNNENSKEIVLGCEIKRKYWDCGFKDTKYGFVVVSNIGIFYNDITEYNKNKGMIELSSRDDKHKPFKISVKDVVKVFSVVKRVRKGKDL